MNHNHEDDAVTARLMTLGVEPLGDIVDDEQDHLVKVTASHSAFAFTPDIVDHLAICVREDALIKNKDELKAIYDKLHKPTPESLETEHDPEESHPVQLLFKVRFNLSKPYRVTVKYRDKHVMYSPVSLNARRRSSSSRASSSLLKSSSFSSTEQDTLEADRKTCSKKTSPAADENGNKSTKTDSTLKNISIRSRSTTAQGSSATNLDNLSKLQKIPPSVRRSHANNLEEMMKKMRLDENLSELINKGSLSCSKPSNHPSHQSSSPGLSGPLNFCNVRSWKRVFDIPNKSGRAEDVVSPIGMCLLPGDKFAVASTWENKIKMFQKSTGRFIKEVYPCQGSLHHPSDMVTLPDNRGFAVRDRDRVMIFDNDGHYKEIIKEGPCTYGLAVDDAGRLVYLESGWKMKTCRLRFLDYAGCDINLTRNVDLMDMIKGRESLSMCRFLTFKNKKFYITDLGLDRVYILEEAEDGNYDLRCFGDTGNAKGQFNDPAGVVVDNFGNMIVADSKNHRLCLYDANRTFKRLVIVSTFLHYKAAQLARPL